MRFFRALRPLPVALAALWPVACDRTELPDAHTASPAGTLLSAPHTRPPDLAILNDPASYQGVNIPGLPAAEPAAGAASGGEAVEQIKSFLAATLHAAISGDIPTVLGSFDPEQIAPLTAHESLLIQTYSKIETVNGLLREKQIPAPDLRNITPEAIQTTVDEVFQGGMVRVQVLDAESAELSLDPQVGVALAQASGAMPAENLASMQQTLSAAGAYSVQLNLESGQWRIHLPFDLTEEQVQVAVQMLGIANKYMDILSDKIAEAESLDQAGLAALGQATLFELLTQLTPEEQQFVQGLMMGARGAPATAPATQEAGEVEELPIDGDGGEQPEQPEQPEKPPRRRMPRNPIP